MSDSRIRETQMPSRSSLQFRSADFETLAEALDYAALGTTGMFFYDRRGNESCALPYSELREKALDVASKLLALDLPRGARVAVVAETTPEFVVFFFACQYAGLVPVPLPAALNLGGHQAYIEQTSAMLKLVGASVVVGSEFFAPSLAQCAGDAIKFAGAFEDFLKLDGSATKELVSTRPDEVAYLQFTSGSTRFPRAVMVKSAAVMANLAGIVQDGVCMGPEDRCLSWLPFYHDMGLVGLVLVPVASQLNVDYLSTRDFAMRPRLWLDLLDRTGATVSFSPPFGYELVAKRLRQGEARKYDLSNWRVAGVGAEMIRGQILDIFAQTVEGSGFNPDSFLPCYGMAECSLAVTFSELSESYACDIIDRELHAKLGVAKSVPAEHAQARGFVECGRALPGYEVEIRDDQGKQLPDRQVGTVFLRGPSIMSGYFNEPEIGRKALSGDGWLNTGDLGYMKGARLVITGRGKDLIIVNGRNVWPQDLEYIAESQEGIRSGDALAFSVPGKSGEYAVVVVQCRERDQQVRIDLIERVRSGVARELGIDCLVELVPAHTLPRTSSGKLSRSRARSDYMLAGGVGASQIETAG